MVLFEKIQKKDLKKGRQVGFNARRATNCFSQQGRSLGLKVKAMCTYEKEFFAILLAIEKWRHFHFKGRNW